MKCPVCIKEGERSTVSGGGGFVTSMPIHAFWDEDGKYHVHNPNERNWGYSCSRGHRWVEGGTPLCPQGDYGEPPTIQVVTAQDAAAGA